MNLCFPITSPAHHRERRNFFLIIIIIIIIIIFRRGVFTNFVIEQNYTERRKTERKKEFKLTLDHRAHHREKKIFFREILIIIIFRGGFSSLGRYVFGSEISYNKAPPRLPGLGC